MRFLTIIVFPLYFFIFSFPSYAQRNDELLHHYIDNTHLWVNDICLYNHNAYQEISGLLEYEQLTNQQRFILTMAKIFTLNCTGQYFFDHEDEQLIEQAKTYYSQQVGNTLFTTHDRNILIEFIWNYPHLFDSEKSCKFVEKQTFALTSGFQKYGELVLDQYCRELATEERIKRLLLASRSHQGDLLYEHYLNDFLYLGYRSLGLTSLALQRALETIPLRTKNSDLYVSYFQVAKSYTLLGEGESAAIYIEKLKNVQKLIGNDEELEVDLLTLSMIKHHRKSEYQLLYDKVTEEKEVLRLIADFYGTSEYDLMYANACLNVGDQVCANRYFQKYQHVQTDPHISSAALHYTFLINYFLSKGNAATSKLYLDLLTQFNNKKQQAAALSNLTALLNDLQQEIVNKDLALSKSTLAWTQRALILVAFAMLVISLLVFILWKQKQHQKTLAERDELTGISNRRATMQFVNGLRAPQDNKLKHCIVLFDIDNFKKINDEHSHLVGDKALKHVTRLIKEHIRATDYFGRIGGEEFLFCLTNIDEAFAQNKVESIRQTLEKSPMQVSGGNPIIITASFAVQVIDDEVSNFENHYLALDKSLYQAKGRGKNCIAFA